MDSVPDEPGQSPPEERQVEDLKGVEELISGSEHRDNFRSLVVMEFSSSAQPATIEWILSRIRASRSQKGGELLAHTVLDKHQEESIVHISATTGRLLMAAELMEIKKPYRDGSLREISMADLDNFQNAEDLDSFLTLAEKQRVIKHELQTIRALESEHHIPGLPKLTLYEGEAIIPFCIKEGIISCMFPLHDREALKLLGRDWYQKIFGVQPIAQIHRYFGESVSLYFAFLGFYTMALIPSAAICFFAEFSSYDNVSIMIFFSVFNLVWATVFLEGWKRYCATLAYQWGTLNAEQFEEARPQYYGVIGRNSVTGRLEPQYPKWKRMAKFYGVSVPVVLACLWVAFMVMLAYFWLQAAAEGFYAKEKSYSAMCVLYMPSVFYAIVISIMNALYRRLAKFLNDWENHRLQSAYNNHLVVKLVLFDFVNCFTSLFYVAFYMQDMALLRSHLALLLITQQVIGQVRESVIPYLAYKRRKFQVQKKHHADDKSDIEPLLKPAVSDEFRHQAELESTKDEYDIQAKIERGMRTVSGTLDDYLEMFLQFGYVFLFSSVFPSAAFWALLNNITEIRTDAFKLCRIFQRPFSEPVSGIGAWQIAFEIMSVMAVVTNTALVFLSPQVQDQVPHYGAVKMVILFVIAEHVLLFIKATISYLIPDAPEWVETAVASVEYESKKAWRKERTASAKRHLERQATRPAYAARIPADKDK